MTWRFSKCFGWEGAPYSSARIYYESFRKDFGRMPLDLPMAVSIFKGDMFTPPKVWGERTYSKLFYWNEVPRGGNFAALEQPQLFVSELRKAFRQVRRDVTESPVSATHS